MIKITNEIDGKKYELVPRIGGVREPCRGCAHYNGWTGQRKTCGFTPYWVEFNDEMVCKKLRGIWKEVRDEDVQ